MALATIESDYLERALVERGVSFDLHPAKRVVVTGFAYMTALGDTQQTWESSLTDDSGVRALEGIEEHLNTRIGALFPEGYNPKALLHSNDEKQGLSTDATLGIVLTRQALTQARLMGEGEQFIDSKTIHNQDITHTISSGMAGADQIIEVHRQTQEGRGSRMKTDLALQVFPEQPGGRTAIALGINGRRNTNSMEACTTSLSSVALGFDILKQGYARAVVVGGMDTLMERHPSETIAAFSSLRALSTRNNEPERASRPYDKDRDGFVLASGGGMVILENEEFAKARGATIYAEVLGVSKTIDGNAMSFDARKALTTEMDPQRVADTFVETMLTPNGKGLYLPKIYGAHATSTKGDRLEALALHLAFGERLKDILITANKSRIAHTLGGAGIINFIMAMQMILYGKVPSILNLENPDPEIDFPLNYVRGRYVEETIDNALVGAFGFGRHNAAVHLARYLP
ncbi:MAG: 3-oxoacyl-[acyl-carrier-protein] synthase II [Microgenomates group bacterium Gr01-1014_7]|nr:MAG: 3-oxoacyl-[acyl-carrier-protein] synthase II [Microgenomates group bacterium Gr01-1014_7]